MLSLTPLKGQPLGWIGLFLRFSSFFGVVTCANLTSMTIAALFPFLRVRTTSKTRGERIIVPSAFPLCGPRRHATIQQSKGFVDKVHTENRAVSKCSTVSSVCNHLRCLREACESIAKRRIETWGRLQRIRSIGNSA